MRFNSKINFETSYKNIYSNVIKGVKNSIAQRNYISYLRLLLASLGKWIVLNAQLHPVF